MRKLVAIALTLSTLSLTMSSVVLAQGSVRAAAQTKSAGSVSGQTVDAAGRAVAGQRVELVQLGVVVATSTTNSRGEYTFANVAAGSYVVRVVVNGTPAGIRVPVIAGAPVTGATIVLPSSVAPSSAFLGPLAPVILAGSVAVFVAVAASGGFNDDDES